jgi:hypothetical protein
MFTYSTRRHAPPYRALMVGALASALLGGTALAALPPGIPFGYLPVINSNGHLIITTIGGQQIDLGLLPIGGVYVFSLNFSDNLNSALVALF